MKVTTQLIVRVEPKLKRAIDRAAKRNGSTIQDWVAKAMKERLARDADPSPAA